MRAKKMFKVNDIKISLLLGIRKCSMEDKTHTGDIEVLKETLEGGTSIITNYLVWMNGAKWNSGILIRQTL